MKNLRKVLAICLALLMVMSFVPAFAATVPSADGITLSRTSSYITVGMTVQLTADAEVSWSTSNGEVATVSESGLVTAVNVGNADITATTADGKTAVCKVWVSELEIRNHQTTPTPDLNGGSFLTDLFGEENFKVMLTFDDNATDVTGNVNTTVKDTLTYEDGFNGKAANFTNGYVELTDAELGNGSITISTWIKPGTLKTAPPDYIISTTPHNPSSNINDGFYVALKSNSVDFFFIRKPAEDTANGVRQTCSVSDKLPTDFYDGWVNLTYVLNKSNNRIYVYVDYELVYDTGIYAVAQWDGEWDPLIGRGVYGGSTIAYDGLMDDFFIYDGAMSAADLQKIKAYYKLVSAVPTEGMSLNTSELSLAINESAILTATITPGDATIPDVVWTTTDANVATVNNGKVVGIGTGNATITATTVDGGFVSSCDVTVSADVKPFLYDRVCLIGVDGGGAWLDDDFMPNVQEIFSPYATTNTCRVSLPSVSAQGWGSIMHGVTPAYHKLTNYIAGGTPYPEDSLYPSFFRVLHEADPDAQMASLVGYSSINTGIVENNIGVTKKSYSSDPAIQEKVLDYLDENTPEILFIQYNDPDSTGHTSGYGTDSPDYVEKMEIVDGYIGEVYAAYEEKGLLDSTLFILTADHGGTPSGSHGAGSDEEMNVFLGVAGPGVKSNSQIIDAEIRDVAAIVVHALGLEKPANWTAKVPDGTFDGVFGQVRNEVPYPYSDYRDHINTKTPSKEGTHLTDIFGEENFDFLYEFDGNTEDTTGNRTTTVEGTIAYEEGYFGKSANLSNGSLTLDKFTIGERDVTIGAWIKTDGFDHRRIFMTNRKDLTLRNGFYISVDESAFTMALQDDSGRTSFSNNYYPFDMNDGWTHVMFVYDYTKGNVKLYYDFEIYNGQNTGHLIDSEDPITIGTLPDYKAYYQFTAAVDDVFMYDGAMTADDIAKLQEYYQREGTALNIGDVAFGSALSFDYEVKGDTTDSTLWAAMYDENMKLIAVKKLPTLTAGGYSIPYASGAKCLKVFAVDENFVPKCENAEAIKD